MKITLLALILSVTLFACSSGVDKTYTPRVLSASDTFDEFPKSKSNILKLDTVEVSKTNGEEHVSVNFKDTVINVQDGKAVATLFRDPRFINSQKTAVVVQVVDTTRKIAPYYLISLKDNKVEVISLDKASNGKKDDLYTLGLVELTRTNFVINNDYIINAVNGRVFSIKRENENQRIQGKFLMYSRDKTTLIFLTDKALYQVNYRSGETETLEVPANILDNQAGIQGEIASNYSWTQNKNGTPFLKYNGNPDRIVDIKEFQK